jgi:uncharacterized protein (TIGR03085 family)
MTDPLFDAAERAHLCDLLGELGPGAPTLLAPWTTRDIAAHLVLRERDHVAAPGLVLPGAWGRLAERRRRALALRDFTWLITTLRSGPPPGLTRRSKPCDARISACNGSHQAPIQDEYSRTADQQDTPCPRSYGMDAAAMSLEQHERGSHAV